MKRCPACRRVLPDDEMVICPYDGTPLLDTVVNSNAFADTVGTESHDSQQSPDPFLERAAQVARKIEYRQKLSALLNSEEGLRLANVEIQNMFSYVKDKVELINQKYPSLQIQFVNYDKSKATVSNSTHVVIISWDVEDADTLSESSLQIIERVRDRLCSKDDDDLGRLGFGFHMDDELKLCWKETSNGRCVTTEKLGQECIDRLLHLISPRE